MANFYDGRDFERNDLMFEKEPDFRKRKYTKDEMLNKKEIIVDDRWVSECFPWLITVLCRQRIISPERQLNKWCLENGFYFKKDDRSLSYIIKK